MSLEVPLEDFVFVTMEEFETYLHLDLTQGAIDPGTGDPLDTAADEASASRALSAACQFVLDYVGDIRLSIGDEVLLDGPGTDSLVLPFKPVWRINFVMEDDTELVEGDDWRASTAGVIYRMAWCRWPYGRARIRVNLDHGYVFPAEEEDPDAALGEPVPASLKQVAMALASRFLASVRMVNIGFGASTTSTPSSDLPAGLVSYITEGATLNFDRISWRDVLTETETAILSRFRAQGGLPIYRESVGIS